MLRKANTTSGGGSSVNKSTEYQSAKHRNFIFQQMMKIDKIDREAEKRNKERLMEIKNKDIEQIIKRTKQEIKEKEMLQTDESIVITHNQEQFDYNRIGLNQDDLDNVMTPPTVPMSSRNPNIDSE